MAAVFRQVVRGLGVWLIVFSVFAVLFSKVDVAGKGFVAIVDRTQLERLEDARRLLTITVIVLMFLLGLVLVGLSFIGGRFEALREELAAVSGRLRTLVEDREAGVRQEVAALTAQVAQMEDELNRLRNPTR